MKKTSHVQKQTNKTPPQNPIICRCNNVRKETIEKAFQEGCKTLNEVYDRTTAGVGPCGGSCRKVIGPLLSEYLEKIKSSNQKTE